MAVQVVEAQPAGLGCLAAAAILPGLQPNTTLQAEAVKPRKTLRRHRWWHQARFGRTLQRWVITHYSLHLNRSRRCSQASTCQSCLIIGAYRLLIRSKEVPLRLVWHALSRGCLTQDKPQMPQRPCAALSVAVGKQFGRGCRA